MSTTVNVRVDKSRVTQQLRDNSAATQQQAAQKAVDDAAAEQVRSNNEALRRRQQDANAKFRESRHDPIARRDGGEVTLPNQLVDGQLTGPVVLEDGAAISVARVGIRRNTSGTKVFVYPWGIEGALGQRLSNDYTTAVSQAWAVGTQIEFTAPSRQPKPKPEGTVGPGPRRYVSGAGSPYDMTPYKYTTLRVPGCYVTKGSNRMIAVETSGICFTNGTANSRLSGYDFVLEESLAVGGVKLSCSYYGGFDADQGQTNRTTTIKTYSDLAVATTTFAPVAGPEAFSQTYEVMLPAGGERVLVALVRRSLSARAFARFTWEHTIRNYTFSGSETGRYCTDIAIEAYIQPFSREQLLADSIVNEVKCVLVSAAATEEVPASDELIEACNALFGKIEPDETTGQVESNTSLIQYYKADSFAALYDSRRVNEPVGISYPLEQIETFYPKTPAYERSNLPKGPYADKPPEQQVLAKQLGIGYLETSDHSGKFFTPAIYEWLDGKAKLATRYSEVSPTFYQPGSANNPFVGVYLSVGNGTEDRIEMRATATQPIDTTTAHTALDWVTINTSSRYGDYLVWDWGNPEYCRQRLAALGMNV